MGLISIGGLGSGLDVSSIVEALVNAERAPKENSLNRHEADVTVTLTGLGGLSGALDELRSAALDLSLSSNYENRSITLSSSDYFSATSTSDATPGAYDIEVTAIAQGSFQESQVFTGGSSSTFGDGTLTFTVGAETFNISVSSTDTLEDIRNNINSATDNDLVSVNLLNNVTDGFDTGSVLTFDSTTLGLGNDLVVTFTGDASLADLSTGLTSTQAASDASILVDGFAATSSTNSFENIIQDVTVNVTKVQDTPGNTESLTIALDTGSTKSLITGFVETYNAYIDVVKQLGTADPNQPGLLVGDFTLRQVSSQIRNLFAADVSAVSGNFSNLSSIGISTTQDGYLEIDNTTLDSALASDFDQFDELFSGDNGFATELRELISNYTGSGGVITSRETSLNAQLNRIDDDRINLALRIEKLEFRLIKQFSAMDAIVAQLNSTQSYIKQQFDNLPGFGNKD
ncbi:MAG: flagellar filament capping protein FliD [Kangiellaceae bacterium]|nr:flagellar filament capping protein FliD [Kangiellaceae bacterium]